MTRRPDVEVAQQVAGRAELEDLADELAGVEVARGIGRTAKEGADQASNIGNQQVAGVVELGDAAGVRVEVGGKGVDHIEIACRVEAHATKRAATGGVEGGD